MLKRLGLIVLLPVLTIACVHESVTPISSDMIQIDVSAAAVYSRADAQRIALEDAAKATIDAGFDKFIVMGSQGWNENAPIATNYGSFNAMGSNGNFNASGSSGGFATILSKPEAKMMIKMFHYQDKGADKAVDAHPIVKRLTSQT